MNILPIGTVVTLNNGKQKVMVISRFPLYNNEGEIGYFDYAGCLYPQGQVNQENFFFNEEDIKEIHFTGYVSEEEEQLKMKFEEEMGNIKYPKLSVG